MSLGGSKAALTTGTRAILVKWTETREHWRDAKGLEFERTYMNELAASVDRAATVIDELEKVIMKIRSECG